MGMHCYIAIENADGTIDYIFCHFDGYLAGIVPLLYKYYSDRTSVELLIKQGGIMILKPPSETMEPSSEPYDKTESAPNREAFYQQWKRDSVFYRAYIQYYYLFTKDNRWECEKNGCMRISDILPAELL